MIRNNGEKAKGGGPALITRGGPFANNLTLAFDSPVGNRIPKGIS